MDKVILGQGCFLEDGVGTFRPNNNQVIVGCSGTGKSMSVQLPTILNMDESSLIATYAKAGEARKVGVYLRKRGYDVQICDLSAPEKSTVGFDPLCYVFNQLDVETLAESVVMANPANTDPKNTYWNDSAILLLSTLINAQLMTADKPNMADVLDSFDDLQIEESGRGITTSLDRSFASLEQIAPRCAAVSGFNDFRQLPYVTAGCVRDTLAKAIRRMFPEPIRRLMRAQQGIDFKDIANKKTALILITSPVNTSLYYFANLIFATGIKQLLEYAEKCRNQCLPNHVRLLFDDFACSAKINQFSRYISIFRAAGISTMLLIQSESQLNSLYSVDEATTILNNCSTYVYFPGGMDLQTCRSVSQRLDIPMTDVLYAPPGQVIVMQSGKKPVITQRYDTVHSPEYKRFRSISLQLDSKLGRTG